MNPAVWRRIGDPDDDARRRPGGILIVADHASNHVPADIDLAIDRSVLSRHIAIDIGVAALAAALCERIGCVAVLAGVSRLVCDFNREEESPGLLPTASDGVAIPGNVIDAAGREARLARFFRPYHAAVAAEIVRTRPAMLLSLHSFTPRLETRPDEARPWEIGILYNRDDRAARTALPLLAAAGIFAGDNEPYSGRILNATMNRHGEANGLPYLGVEIRQDLIDTPAGVARWAQRLAPIAAATRDAIVAAGHDASAILS